MSALANGKHEAVLQAYLADPDRLGWRAYTKVYPEAKKRAAATAWSRLLKNAEFSSRLAELEASVTAKVVEASAISIEMVIKELAKLGFSNARNFVRITADGEPAVDLSDATEEQFASLQSISVEDFVDGRVEATEELEPQAQGGALRRRRGREVRRVTFKLHPKIPALVAIGEHLGAFKGKGESPARAEQADQPQADAPAAPLSRLEIARRIAWLLRVPDEKPAPANAAPAAAEPPREKRAPR